MQDKNNRHSAVNVAELGTQASGCMQAAFVEHVAKLVNGGSITGVSDVRDESDRDGMRVVLELRRGTNAEVVINNLYKQTVLQTTFPCNMVALVDATPQTLNLKQFLQHFLDFRWVCCMLGLISGDAVGMSD